MSKNNSLLEVYKKTDFQTIGHGERNIQVLLEAMKNVDPYQESDIYGKGKLIEDFQEKMAEFLGKESAVFFPSGTMAQQIALRIWSDQTGIKKVAYHPLCHLEIHENEGLKHLHNLEPVLLASQNRIIELEDVINLTEDISCVLLELPQREIGGQLPDYQTLVSISDYCRENGIKLHLDGARLFEILPYYQKTAAEISKLFDSVYVSVYKGLGGVAGAVLAGSEQFTEKSKVWKRRHGGDLISIYPYIISADYYLEQRLPNMEQYYEGAKELAALFNQCEKVETLPLQPVSNMFHVHVHISKEQLELILISIYEQTHIGLTSNVKEKKGGTSYFEVSIGDRYSQIPKKKLREVFQMLNKQLNER